MRKSLIISLIIPVIVVAVGISLNRFVMYANGGKMPVDMGVINAPVIGRSLDDKRIVMTDLTKFPYLGDVLALPHVIFSIGDFAILTGLYLMVRVLFQGVKEMTKRFLG